MIYGEMREIKTMEQAQALLEEWIKAYQELLRDYRRLEMRYSDALWLAEHHEFMRRHLDPFLPPSMQDAHARAAEPHVYSAMAELVAEQRQALPAREALIEEYDPFP